ncbi:hypothetical protein ACFY3G_00275 [Streptomyces phaeochromogenes]|uniref:hypothetical protein n=1 Tax=Streptomyces phaeochromogenes TaxID=1923 RepID=UPI00369218B5
MQLQIERPQGLPLTHLEPLHDLAQRIPHPPVRHPYAHRAAEQLPLVLVEFDPHGTGPADEHLTGVHPEPEQHVPHGRAVPAALAQPVNDEVDHPQARDRVVQRQLAAGRDIPYELRRMPPHPQIGRQPCPLHRFRPLAHRS